MKQLIIKFLSAFVPELLTLLRIYRHQLRNKDSYLNVTGWTRSVAEKRPCQSDGSAVPWMNYSVITLLRGRLNKQMRLFEYGSGYSTLFFSELVGEVVALEYDPTWYEKISKKLPANARIIQAKSDVDGCYCRAIYQVDGYFDIVVVDGRDRVNSIKQALGKLNEEGIILLDDSQEGTLPGGYQLHDLPGIQATGFGRAKASRSWTRSNYHLLQAQELLQHIR